MRKIKPPMTVAWFSGGVSSSVAIKLLIDQVDVIVYIHVDDQHPDTIRFVSDCERWYNKPIIRLQSRYRSVEGASLAYPYQWINGPGGSPCSRFLKSDVRKTWAFAQRKTLTYIWGLDGTENLRAEKIRKGMPKQKHLFPLLENSLTKTDCHKYLRTQKIRRPYMYELGYRNNNCIGCVRGGAGYWCQIKNDFPEVYARRSALERRIGSSCLRDRYLDELPANSGRAPKKINDEPDLLSKIDMPEIDINSIS